PISLRAGRWGVPAGYRDLRWTRLSRKHDARRPPARPVAAGHNAWLVPYSVDRAVDSVRLRRVLLSFARDAVHDQRQADSGLAADLRDPPGRRLLEAGAGLVPRLPTCVGHAFLCRGQYIGCDDFVAGAGASAQPFPLSVHINRQTVTVMRRN